MKPTCVTQRLTWFDESQISLNYYIDQCRFYFILLPPLLFINTETFFRLYHVQKITLLSTLRYCQLKDTQLRSGVMISSGYCSVNTLCLLYTMLLNGQAFIWHYTSKEMLFIILLIKNSILEIKKYFMVKGGHILIDFKGTDLIIHKWTRPFGRTGWLACCA